MVDDDPAASLSRRALVLAAASLPALAPAPVAPDDAAVLARVAELRRLWTELAELEAAAEALPFTPDDPDPALDEMAAELAEQAEAAALALAAAPALTARGLLAKLRAVHDDLEFARWLEPDFQTNDADDAIRASLARDLHRLTGAGAA